MVVASPEPRGAGACASSPVEVALQRRGDDGVRGRPDPHGPGDRRTRRVPGSRDLPRGAVEPDRVRRCGGQRSVLWCRDREDGVVSVSEDLTTGYWPRPTRPSTRSQIRTACQLCRAYSSSGAGPSRRRQWRPGCGPRSRLWPVSKRVGPTPGCPRSSATPRRSARRSCTSVVMTGDDRDRRLVAGATGLARAGLVSVSAAAAGTSPGRPRDGADRRLPER